MGIFLTGVGEGNQWHPFPLSKVISGGQSGVDRAALDWALSLGIAVGGWCPRGRWAEDGFIHMRYPLRETPKGRVTQRTIWNVRDSDGTLILCRGEPFGGTALTGRLARRMGRPLLVIDLHGKPDPRRVLSWIRSEGIHRMNVAGPRESGKPGIYRQSRLFLEQVGVVLQGMERAVTLPSST